MIYYESEYYGIQRMDDVIAHHGIKGQKWGVRRFQNEDGSLTPAGRERYLTDLAKGKASIKDSPNSKAKQDYRKAREAFGKAEMERDKLRNEFYADMDGKTVEKYSRISAEKHWDEAKKSGWTDDRKAEWVKGYTHGDFDQGKKTAFDYWLEDNHADHVKHYTESGRAHAKARKALVKDIVGEHSGMTVKARTSKYDWNKRKLVDSWERMTVDDLVNRRIDFMDSPDDDRKKRNRR